MATSRRLILLSCFLAVVLTAGSALPPLALWQCRHASRVVIAADAPRSVMPCRMDNRAMGDAPMPPMACCPPETGISPASSPHQSAVSRPACHPNLTRLAALPPASVSKAHAHLRRSLALLLPSFLLTAALLPPVPAVLSLRQRPPPTLGVSQSALKHAPGLRAPPAA